MDADKNELLQLQFTRQLDGHKCEVECCAYPRCKNYFWVQHLKIDPPKFCPYCDLRFEGIEIISAEEMAAIQNF